MRTLIMMTVLMIALVSFAQAASDFSVFYDLVFFKDLSDKDLTFGEFYLAVNMADLAVKQEGSRWVVGYEASLELTSLTTQKRLVNETWKKSTAADDTLSLIKDIIDQVNLALKPDKYALNLTIKDQHSARQTTYPDTISFPSFDGSALMTGFIEFCSTIEATDREKGDFVKNGMFIQPNPSRFYGAHLGVLYFYTEVYNLNLAEGAQGTFRADYRVLDFTGKEVKKLPTQTIDAYGPNAVLASGIKVGDFAPGTYFLNVTVTDPVSGIRFTKTDRFHIFQPQQPQAVQQDVASLIPELSAVNEEIYYGEVKYHLDEKEYQQYQMLTYEGKRNFLLEFWQRHDPTPTTALNENYLENKRRFEVANEKFSYGNVPGWKTDEGRVFILYGQFNELEEVENSLETKPYRIWHYYDLGSDLSLTDHLKGKAAYFFFYQHSFDGKYTLVHSNVTGEVKDPDFVKQIIKLENKESLIQDRQYYIRGQTPD